MYKEAKKDYEILWTGGFDSSFRIAELSRQDVTVQPYYISDNREVEEQELEAIRKISELLYEKKETKFNLLPLKYIKRSEITVEPYISEAYHGLNSEVKIGSQYEWLASFSKNHIGIELGAVNGGKIGKLVNDNGGFLEIKEKTGDNYKINKETTRDDIYTIFGDYCFPLLKRSKIDIKNEFKKWGYEDVMNVTWFCHHPIKGEPCGMCNPCKVTLEEGLIERFTVAAKIRYRFRFPAKYIRAGFRRLQKQISKI